MDPIPPSVIIVKKEPTVMTGCKLLLWGVLMYLFIRTVVIISKSAGYLECDMKKMPENYNNVNIPIFKNTLNR